MADKDERDRERETNYSAELGERNRNTPGRTPGELGLDPEEMGGHDVVGGLGDRATEGASVTGVPREERKNPPQTPDVEKMGEGGIAASGGRAGGERGNAGPSDGGAGGPEGEARGGPGQYKGTSRSDLDHGSTS